jgi:hypothetical protein
MANKGANRDCSEQAASQGLDAAAPGGTQTAAGTSRSAAPARLGTCAGRTIPQEPLMKTITRDQLLECLDYCKETGVFTWKNSRSAKVKPGTVAGCVDKSHGYHKIRVLGGLFYSHRLAWLVVHGELPSLQVDHIDGNRSNNAIANLRTATQSEQNQNLRTGRGRRKGQPLCVYPTESGRWRTRIKINGKQIELGRFDTQEQAVAAYLEAKKNLHPFQTIAR